MQFVAQLVDGTTILAPLDLWIGCTLTHPRRYLQEVWDVAGQIMTPALQIPANSRQTQKTRFCEVTPEINGFRAHRQESPPPELHCQSNQRGLPLGNLTSQLWANFFLDPLDHWITETMRFGAYARYTDDFLIFANDKATLHELRTGIESHLAALRLELAADKTRLMTTSEGVPFCGFVFHPGLRPRVLGATKRRFEQRRSRLTRTRDFFALSQAVVSWYAFSREGNATGLHRAYARWSLRQLRAT